MRSILFAMLVFFAQQAWALEVRLAERLEDGANDLQVQEISLQKRMKTLGVTVPPEMDKAVRSLLTRARQQAKALRDGKGGNLTAVRDTSRQIRTVCRMLREIRDRDGDADKAVAGAMKKVYGALLQHMTAMMQGAMAGDRKTALLEKGQSRLALLKLEQIQIGQHLIDEFAEVTRPLQQRKEDPAVKPLLKQMEERFGSLKKSLALRNELEQEQAMLEVRQELIELRREEHNKLMEDIDREFEELEEEVQGLLERAEEIFEDDEEMEDADPDQMEQAALEEEEERQGGPARQPERGVF